MAEGSLPACRLQLFDGVDGKVSRARGKKSILNLAFKSGGARCPGREAAPVPSGRLQLTGTIVFHLRALLDAPLDRLLCFPCTQPEPRLADLRRRCAMLEAKRGGGPYQVHLWVKRRQHSRFSLAHWVQLVMQGLSASCHRSVLYRLCGLDLIESIDDAVRALQCTRS